MFLWACPASADTGEHRVGEMQVATLLESTLMVR
jgi:hypothetical protein